MIQRLIHGTPWVEIYLSSKRLFDWEREQGIPGIEPGTTRIAVECSATELYPLLFVQGQTLFFLGTKYIRSM